MNAIKFKTKERVVLDPDVQHLLAWDDSDALLYPGGSHSEVEMGGTDFLGGLLEGGSGGLSSIPIIGPIIDKLGGLLGLLTGLDASKLPKNQQEALELMIKELQVQQVKLEAAQSQAAKPRAKK